MSANQNSNGTGFLDQRGPTFELIRSTDWSKTAIGPQETWPQSFQSALSICVNSNFPIAIYWGRDLVLLYNDAWSPIPGNKHPWAFGKTAVEVWPDIWTAIEPQFEKAFSGRPGGSKDALLPMQRHGYTEECYFDFTFTPIYGESGNVEGIFNAVIETTYRVINERRAGVVQRLAQSIKGSATASEVLDRALLVMGEARADIPFFFFYNVTAGTVVQYSQFPFAEQNADSVWPADQVIGNGITLIVEELPQFLPYIPHVYWPETPVEAAIVPLKGNDGIVFGFIVCGASARRRVDNDYRAFFDSLANIISGEINTISSLEKERQRAEALAEIDRAKTTFFSNISHEFRTPLTLMLSPLEELIDSSDNLSEAQAANLQTSLRNSLRLQKLVNTLLDFSRIEAGKLDAKFERVDIARVTVDLASTFRSAIESSGIEYNVSIEDVRHPVEVDVDIWEKIVLNLISNAFKYTERGRIDVKLYEKENVFILEVSDTGVGISDEHLHRIFERFYRVNNQGGRSQEGTGIGLAMVKELVHLHHGDIRVTSEAGRGTTFTVTVPFLTGQGQIADAGTKGLNNNSNTRKAYLEEAAKWNKSSSTDVDRRNGGRQSNKPVIVVADDNSDMRDYMTRLLHKDFNVHAVTNGEDAFEVSQQVMPDLVLSDIMMPRLDGFGLLAKLRSHLTTRSIPVIFLSARAGDEAKIEGIQAGADDYLVKPFSANELLARINNQIAINTTRRKTEKEFYNLFIQSPAHIHVFKGPEHIVEFFHPLGAKMIGRDISGMKIREAVPELEGQGFFELLDDVYINGKTIDIPESKALLPDEGGQQKEHYFHITYLPWRDLDGKIQGVLQFTLEVTEQAKANIKLKESEAQFRVLANSIPQYVWIADATGKIEYMSDQWEHYSGTSIETGKTAFSSFIHKDDVDEVRTRWASSMKTKQPWKSEFRLRNEKTGEYRWFSGHTVPIYDDHGNVVRWIGSSSDIHAQKTANFELEELVAERTAELIKLNVMLKSKNEELLRAQNFLQTVLDSSVELVTALDKDLNVAFVNKRIKSLTNRAPEDLIGRNILQLAPGIEKTESYKLLQKALDGETTHIKASSSQINPSLVFESFVIPLKQHGKVTGVVTMQRDITSIMKLTEQLRESNEQLRRSNDDLQQFAHVTSHDLKEPVRKIKMYGNILNNDFSNFLPDKGKDYLSRIDKAASRISSMIDGVLQYATVETSDQAMREIDLNEVVKNIVEDLEIPINEHQAHISYHDLPVIVGFPTLIYQLFYNLVNNSLKFRKKDVPPEIDFIYTPSPDVEEGDYFIIQVQDNGVGFEPAYSEKIFESFIRLHPKDKYEGTGLGLALCRKIALRHRGFINASSQAERGAVFSVYFPTTILKD
ncbi:ATP-binding protein [Chryseolinea sp. T2]|uniref:ATP-binding protein n=1 Tax=Chryseolinea sp. T2 TaxID=3129255 RepID=UPI003076B311